MLLVVHRSSSSIVAPLLLSVNCSPLPRRSAPNAMPICCRAKRGQQYGLVRRLRGVGEATLAELDTTSVIPLLPTGGFDDGDALER